MLYMTCSLNDLFTMLERADTAEAICLNRSRLRSTRPVPGKLVFNRTITLKDAINGSTHSLNA